MPAPRDSQAQIALAPPEWVRKPWGRTCELLCQPDLQLCLIEVEPFAACSRHLHKQKINRFIVREGHLIVRVWTGSEQVETHLREGQHLDVPAWTVHQFQAVGPCRAMEAYFPAHARAQVLSEDIVRIAAAA